MSRRRTLIAGTVVLAGIAAAALGYQQLRNTTTPVSAERAVERFEAAEATPSTTSAPPAAPTATNGLATPTPDVGPATVLTLPAPGVYPVAIEGEERIDLLTGASRTYPGTGFLTVTATECGVDLRWDFVEERWQSWSFCRGDEGPELRGEQIFHSFFGQDDLVDRVCTDSTVSTDAEVWRCEGGGSVAVRDVSLTPATRSLDGLGERDVLVLRSELLEGDRAGNIEDIELWWDLATGLPLFETRTYDFTLDTPLGDAAYDEAYTATLVSLDPLTAE